MRRPMSLLLRIGAWLPRPPSVRFIEGREELREGQIKRPGESIDDIHRRGLLPPLKVTHVGPVQPGFVGQCFLREVETPSQSPNAPAQRHP